MSPLERLHRGEAISDAVFDAMYAPRFRELSELFWTPVGVAMNAAKFLAPSPKSRVLDIGSGVGKFCFVGSSVTEGLFHGVEQRLDLVEASRTLSSGAPGHVEFSHGNMVDVDWSEFDSFFLYNPFHELVSGPWCQIDDTVKYSPQTQKHYVDAVVEKLASAKTGTRVATYFGFGGQLPNEFELVSSEPYGKGPLRLWIKSEGVA